MIRCSLKQIPFKPIQSRQILPLIRRTRQPINLPVIPQETRGEPIKSVVILPVPVRMILPNRARIRRPEMIRVPMIRELQPETIKEPIPGMTKVLQSAMMTDKPMIQLRNRKVRLSQIRHKPPMQPTLQKLQRENRIPIFKRKWMPWNRQQRHWMMPYHPVIRISSQKPKPLTTRQKLLWTRQPLRQPALQSKTLPACGKREWGGARSPMSLGYIPARLASDTQRAKPNEPGNL